MKDYDKIELEKLSTDKNWVEISYKLIQQIRADERKKIVEIVQIFLLENMCEEITAKLCGKLFEKIK